MASAAVLRRLQSRASEAEALLAVMRDRVSSLRQSAVVRVSGDKAVRLSEENAKLRSDIIELKEQLKQAELANGVVQVEMQSTEQKGRRPVVTSHDLKGQQVVTPPPAVVPSSGDDRPVRPPPEQKTSQKKKPAKQEVLTEVRSVDVSRLDMRVGQIVAVKLHPDADSLYVEEVDVGEGEGCTRTIISGLVKHVTLENMLNRRAVFLCNLKPAKMRGILSHGMIMCASTPDKVEVIAPPDGANIGDRVRVPEFPGEPDALLNPKKKIWEQVKPDLRVNADGAATYKGAPWRVEGLDMACLAATMTDCPIS